MLETGLDLEETGLDLEVGLEMAGGIASVRADMSASERARESESELVVGWRRARLVMRLLGSRAPGAKAPSIATDAPLSGSPPGPAKPPARGLRPGQAHRPPDHSGWAPETRIRGSEAPRLRGSATETRIQKIKEEETSLLPTGNACSFCTRRLQEGGARAHEDKRRMIDADLFLKTTNDTMENTHMDIEATASTGLRKAQLDDHKAWLASVKRKHSEITNPEEQALLPLLVCRQKATNFHS